MTPAGFKPTISADKRPETYTLGCAATGTNIVLNTLYKNYKYDNNELRHCYCYKVKFARVFNSTFAKFV
jgi:hypothetical protein